MKRSLEKEIHREKNEEGNKLRNRNDKVAKLNLSKQSKSTIDMEEEDRGSNEKQSKIQDNASHEVSDKIRVGQKEKDKDGKAREEIKKNRPEYVTKLRGHDESTSAHPKFHNSTTIFKKV